MTNQQRILKNSQAVTECGCWIWTGAISNAGYGISFTEQNKTSLAHRVSYEAFVDKIPLGKILAHTCDNRLCVNPNHLWIATHKENSEDMVKKNRSAKGEKCGKSKLKNEQIKFIRESNLSHRKLGVMFNVSHTNIGYIKRNKIWI